MSNIITFPQGKCPSVQDIINDLGERAQRGEIKKLLVVCEFTDTEQYQMGYSKMNIDNLCFMSKLVDRHIMLRIDDYAIPPDCGHDHS